MHKSIGQSMSEDSPISRAYAIGLAVRLGRVDGRHGGFSAGIPSGLGADEDALSEFRTSPSALLVLVAIYTGAFWLRAIAWRELLTQRIGLFSLFTALQAALFANHILPFKLGEFARPMVAQGRGLPLAQAAASTAIARILDFSALIVIASVVGAALAITSGRGLWVQGLALPAATVTGIAAMLALLRWHRIQDWLPGPVQALVGIFRDQLNSVTRGSLAGSNVDAAQLGAGGQASCSLQRESWESSYRLPLP